MPLSLPIDIDAIKGFLAEDEAEALLHFAREQAGNGPLLEVGSYCGKSTLYLAAACREAGSVVYAVDHHIGSEEHQLGEMFHDPELYNAQEGIFDTFNEFRRNLRTAGLTDYVVPLVAPSSVCARHWQTPLAMVFIDGGHSLEAALEDYRCWAAHLQRGGILAIHDLFPNPEEGGQAPIAVYRLALASGLFEAVSRVNSLGVLRRI
ncbi:class I SAM-dependent methyltransferase [Spongiibacter sp. KMU-166]|uniref:Class I SAM-dependent methyltransferase n=1 Tax=Spongiibacter thalassae TaxID=2721624 RepID=A0ABX1GJF9_9GAMM|nr:class I SAM-dependent methyltransferase [Spongiibacter thalassae]NKI18492.1 class I SAM-dependent methyltransferase [Spongiibacter thalassae]